VQADPTPPPTPRRSLRKRIALSVAVALVAYLVLAYVLAPLLWTRYMHRHPSFDNLPDITHTADGHPGDPLNVALVGSKAEVVRVMLASKWHPADPLTLRSSLEIAAASVFRRPDEDAPVSNLFLFGRKEDLAFEQEVGHDPRHRHHVRFWLTDRGYEDGRPIWIGSAVYDDRVELSRTTGQVTHMTAPDVDAERDYLFQCLAKSGDLAEKIVINDFHKVHEGRNGGGNIWRTDGDLYGGVTKPEIVEAVK
jgi:LssY C-terminus